MSKSFHTKITGVTQGNRQELTSELEPGDPLHLERAPENDHDPNAIKVLSGRDQVGWIRSGLTQKIAPRMDSGKSFSAIVANVTGGGEGENFGVNIEIFEGEESKKELPFVKKATYAFCLFVIAFWIFCLILDYLDFG